MPEPADEPPAPAAPPADFAETMRAALAAADADVPAKPETMPAVAGEAGPRRSIAAVFGWLLFALTVGAIAFAVFAQGEIMAAYPQSRAIYQMLRFPVPAPGDGLEVVTAPPTRAVVDGKTVLEIAGTIRNTGEHPRPVPAMRAQLRDAGGKDVATWDFKADAARVRPGAEVTFKTTLADPPAVAGQLTILFVEEF